MVTATKLSPAVSTNLLKIELIFGFVYPSP